MLEARYALWGVDETCCEPPAYYGNLLSSSRCQASRKKCPTYGAHGLAVYR